jgi:hypothetical protein
MGDKNTPLEHPWEDSFQNCATGPRRYGAGHPIGRLGVRLPLDRQLEANALIEPDRGRFKFRSDRRRTDPNVIR